MAHNQFATFEYFQWRDIYKTEKPYEILINLPSDKKHLPTHNLAFETVRNLKVEDVRGHESEFCLDTHGFLWKRHRTTVTDWKSRDAIVNYYLPEMERFIKDHIIDADRVFIFDWRVC
jgi:hypothetical protein